MSSRSCPAPANPPRVAVLETGDSVAPSTDGSFDLPAPSGTTATLVTPTNDPIWFGSATRITLQDGAAEGVEFPLVSLTVLDDTRVASGVLPVDGFAQLVVQVDSGGAPASGVALGPILDTDSLYDTADPLVFAPDFATGSAGTGVYFDAPLGTRSFAVDGASESTFLVADALTVERVVLPP